MHHSILHVSGRIRSWVCQEHTFIEIVGKAGVIAGAAAARVRHWRSDRRDILSLAQLLDEETLVTALLLTMTPQMLNSINKTYSIQGVTNFD